MSRITEIRRRVRRRLRDQERRNASRHTPRPRYDDVYAAGVAWLDGRDVWQSKFSGYQWFARCRVRGTKGGFQTREEAIAWLRSGPSPDVDAMIALATIGYAIALIFENGTTLRGALLELD